MSSAVPEVALVLDARADLGEGPVWDAAAQRLVWVDIMAGRVHLFEPATGGCRTLPVGRPVGAAALDRRGGLVLAVPEGFARLDPKTAAVAPIAPLPTPRPHVRMNDGRCDRAGRFWAGTMGVDERPGKGALYRLDPSGAVFEMLPDVTISNGLDCPTSCAFGGPDLRDLYVTTARTALSAEERARQPAAGGVFRLRPGVSGRLPSAFGA